MNARHLAALILTASAAALTACSGGGRAPSPHAQAPAFDPIPEGLPDPVSLGLFDADGYQTPWLAMVERAARADVVIIGEQHGHPAGLHAAAVLFNDILDRAPAAALSLEFMERDEQAHLDDYLTDVTTEAEFMAATKRSPGNYPFGHRAMVHSAKTEGRPVIASNAPRRYVSLGRKQGMETYDTLTDEQRRLFRLPGTLTTGPYRDRFFDLMSGMSASHGGDGAEMTPEEQAEMDAMVESFFFGQNVWDATMADSISDAMSDGSRPIVHVVGQFHSDYDGGLVERLRTLRPGVDIVTVTVNDQWSSALLDEDRGRADYVLYVGPRE